MFEIVNVSSELRIPPKRVGYSSVLRALRTSPTAIEPSKRGRVIKSLEKLDEKDAKALIAFRHNVTHWLQPRIEKEQPPLMLQYANGTWDSQSPSPTHARRLLHCATWMWLRCVEAVREIAVSNLLPHLATTVRPKHARESHLPIRLHKGLTLRANGHHVNVRCMSECQGVIGELFLDKNIDDKNQAFTILSEVLKKCLTIYDVENRGGHAIQVETDRSLILVDRSA